MDDLGNCGSTVNLIYICIENEVMVIYSANVGDSRNVLIRKSESVRLSYDHKASDKSEQKRVRVEGGIIVKNRLFGILAVTRALADFELKDSEIEGLSNIPYVSRTELKPDDDKYIIMGSDGVWDVISDDYIKKISEEFDHCELNPINNTLNGDTERIEIKNENVKESLDLASVIVSKAIDFGSTDNISCIVIKLG